MMIIMLLLMLLYLVIIFLSLIFFLCLHKLPLLVLSYPTLSFFLPFLIYLTFLSNFLHSFFFLFVFPSVIEFSLKISFMAICNFYNFPLSSTSSLKIFYTVFSLNNWAEKNYKIDDIYSISIRQTRHFRIKYELRSSFRKFEKISEFNFPVKFGVLYLLGKVKFNLHEDKKKLLWVLHACCELRSTRPVSFLSLINVTF